MHALLDYTTAAALIGLGVKLRRQHPRASSFAYVNALTVLMASLLTDYPGGIFRKLSFLTHGMIDVAQASLMALGPPLLGFGRDRVARVFYAQAAMEAGVVVATDWESSASSPASVA
jgi:hypothetical protein